MTTTHPQADLFAGDDWEIHATLLDQDGNPYDLSGSPEILWTLLNHNNQKVINGTGVTVTVTDPAGGKCTVLIDGSATTNLPSGLYNDVLRLVIGDVSTTLLVGPIHLSADPWKVP
jgi:hypothetical protein